MFLFPQFFVFSYFQQFKMTFLIVRYVSTNLAILLKRKLEVDLPFCSVYFPQREIKLASIHLRLFK